MKNIMTIDGEKALVSFDPELAMFRGEFAGLSGGADFYSTSVEGLQEEGRKSLALYLELCREKGIEPRRRFSGKFNIRIDPTVHAAAVQAAAANDMSLNEWIGEAIVEAVGSSR
ncbi:type II toxin-antitoxin system HicB family antitoxin [Aureimonas psammosilenae]|uniref:type II toxin-antitoxin system HicB family antitoxin n=1 Tax=Aureimonas psammosilenae TaxID=2495496 RepID=UPI0012606246|nr:type II toxin-antitoxin system HicB family antitoxin [Aureimonas psammosilenae]